jgi:hypothetical protein
MGTGSFMGTASVMAQFQSNPDPLRIAMLGCVKQTEPIPAFESYAKLDADISLWI